MPGCLLEISLEDNKTLWVSIKRKIIKRITSLKECEVGTHGVNYYCVAKAYYTAAAVPLSSLKFVYDYES